MSAHEILNRVNELIDAEIADRVRNARAEAIRDCAALLLGAAEQLLPGCGSIDRLKASVMQECAQKLESIR